MLELFRGKILSWVTKILFFILILSFGMWGIGDYLRGSRGGGLSGSQAIVSVGNTEYGVDDFRAALNDQTNRLRRVLGNRITSEQLRQLGLTEQALNILIQRGVVAEGAAELGLTATDATVREAIRSDQRFFGASGTFDRNLFESATRASGLTEDAYVNLLRQQIVRRQLLSGIEFGRMAPDILVREIFRYRNEQRIAQVVRIDHAKIEGVGEPDDATLHKYYDETKRRFTAPEYRAITLVLLDAGDIAKTVAVDEERLRKAYKDRVDEFTVPEKRHVLQFLVGDQETADQAVQRLQRGEDFFAVAKELGGIDEKTADLGLVTERQLPLPGLAKEVFAMSAPGIAKPVHSDLGWHVVDVTEIVPKFTRPFDDVREQLKKDVIQEIAVDALITRANQFEDAIGGGASLEDAAGKFSIVPIKIAATDALGRTPEETPVSGLPEQDEQKKEILKTAFATEQGELSTLKEMGETGYYMLRVDNITPPAVRPLDKVRDEVVTAWKRKRRSELAEAKAQEALAKMNSGAPIGEIAKSLGTEATTTKPFKRTGEGLEQNLPPDLIGDLFSTEPGKGAVAEGADAHFVGRVNQIIAADPASDPDGMKKLRAELTRSVGNDIAVEFSTALRQRFGVSVNRAAIEKIAY